MKLDDIVNEILEISKAIGSNTHTKSQLDAKKMLAAADLLASIVQPFIPNVTKSYTPSKSKLKVALRSLKKAASDYNIKEDLRKPIKDLEAYLDSLG